MTAAPGYTADGRYVEPDEPSGPFCSVCGDEMDWHTCEGCGGMEGWFETTEESAHTEEEWQECDTCEGAGGWWRCWRSHHPEVLADERDGVCEAARAYLDEPAHDLGALVAAVRRLEVDE